MKIKDYNIDGPYETTDMIDIGCKRYDILTESGEVIGRLIFQQNDAEEYVLTRGEAFYDDAFISFPFGQEKIYYNSQDLLRAGIFVLEQHCGKELDPRFPAKYLNAEMKIKVLFEQLETLKKEAQCGIRPMIRTYIHRIKIQQKVINDHSRNEDILKNAAKKIKSYISGYVDFLKFWDDNRLDHKTEFMANIKDLHEEILKALETNEELLDIAEEKEYLVSRLLTHQFIKGFDNIAEILQAPPKVLGMEEESD